MTEYTDKDKRSIGVLYYDGTCKLCVRWALRLDALFAGQGLQVLPFGNGADADEMRLYLNDGREFGGADAVWILAGKVWWAFPITLLTWLPGVRPVMRAFYRRLAMSRHCRGGKCELGPVAKANFYSQRRVRLPWALGLLIVGGGWWVGRDLPVWGLMWVLAVSQYLAFKVMVLSQVSGGNFWQRMGFVFLWPGMDAGVFFSGYEGKAGADWKEGAMFTLTGAVLLLVVSGKMVDPVLAGWAGMLGLIAFMHFGVFALIARFWQDRGYGARPIMEAPWRASSLADFWGRRWNRAFSDVARLMVFRPLSRKYGVSIALLAGFVFSGLAHELVITVPAGAGYGLPTLYFLIQAMGVMLERKLELSRGMASLWVWLVVLGPAYYLFSPTFMERVIAPFMNVIENLTVIGN